MEDVHKHGHHDQRTTSGDHPGGHHRDPVHGSGSLRINLTLDGFCMAMILPLGEPYG